MIRLHFLQFSRATRVLWLLENIGQPYDRVDYKRTDAIRAPDALSDVHPLGKSPVIEDGGRVIAESGTILRYLDDTYGASRHQPERGSEAFWRHEELLEFAESSFAEVVLAVILPAFRGKDVSERAQKALRTHLSYLEQALEGRFLCGDTLMLADIQMSYLLALLDRSGLLKGHPPLEAYWTTLQRQPGYIAAVEAAGPMAPPK